MESPVSAGLSFCLSAALLAVFLFRPRPTELRLLWQYAEENTLLASRSVRQLIAA
jgi:hypothetical protein